MTRSVQLPTEKKPCRKTYNRESLGLIMRLATENCLVFLCLPYATTRSAYNKDLDLHSTPYHGVCVVEGCKKNKDSCRNWEITPLERQATCVLDRTTFGIPYPILLSIDIATFFNYSSLFLNEIKLFVIKHNDIYCIWHCQFKQDIVNLNIFIPLLHIIFTILIMPLQGSHVHNGNAKQYMCCVIMHSKRHWQVSCCATYNNPGEDFIIT